MAFHKAAETGHGCKEVSELGYGCFSSGPFGVVRPGSAALRLYRPRTWQPANAAPTDLYMYRRGREKSI